MTTCAVVVIVVGVLTTLVGFESHSAGNNPHLQLQSIQNLMVGVVLDCRGCIILLFSKISMESNPLHVNGCLYIIDSYQSQPQLENCLFLVNFAECIDAWLYIVLRIGKKQNKIMWWNNASVNSENVMLSLLIKS